jgi:hypothetical protein
MFLPDSSALPTEAKRAVQSGKSPILPALVNKVGREARFAWVACQLAMEGDTRVLYYATPGTADSCNGRVVLHTDADLSRFGQGDLVLASGQLQGSPGPDAVYIARTVTLVEIPWHPSR